MKIITRDLSTAKGGIERNTVEGVCTRAEPGRATKRRKKGEEGGGEERLRKEGVARNEYSKI